MERDPDVGKSEDIKIRMRENTERVKTPNPRKEFLSGG
jgi:hypothetical protein